MLDSFVAGTDAFFVCNRRQARNSNFLTGSINGKEREEMVSDWRHALSARR